MRAAGLAGWEKSLRACGLAGSGQARLHPYATGPSHTNTEYMHGASVTLKEHELKNVSIDSLWRVKTKTISPQKLFKVANVLIF